MKKKALFLLYIFIIFSAFAQQNINVIPAPQQWKYLNDSIRFEAVNISCSKDATEEQLLFLERFKKEIELVGIEIGEPNKKSTLSLFFETNYQNLGAENDIYEISFDRKTVIKLSSYNALVYSTRTILQLFSQEKYRNCFPKGEIIDFPLYQKRAMLLDVARKFFTIEQVEDFIKIMAWVKLNELHLHLSDNSWGGYSAYRLESDLYPELTAKDGHYSWDEIRALQDFAATYGVEIVPEIDSPGHSLVFTNVRPDLKSKWLSSNYLDITNPDTYLFMEEILNEVIPHFDAQDFHLGTDEYRIYKIKNDSLKYEIGNSFRGYINHFNKVVKSHGKTARIWSGFEHMPGDTQIDSDIVIDMWETSDAQDKSDKGYRFINSSHFYTYIVPGAPYYGVDNKFVYEKWTPEIFSDKKDQNLEFGASGLLGSKLHIWNDFGPTGFTISEIARLSVPSIVTFSEKMWGTKAYNSYPEFQKNMIKLLQIPDTEVLDRSFENELVVFQIDNEIDFKKDSFIKTNSVFKNVEYPWTLKTTLLRSEFPQKNELLLSSNNAEIYTQLEHVFAKKGDTIVKKGFAIVRANQTEGENALSCFRPQIVVFDYQIPLNREVEIELLGGKGRTSLYVDGEFVGSENIQMLCPVEVIGSEDRDVFHGVIKNLTIKQLQEK